MSKRARYAEREAAAWEAQTRMTAAARQAQVAGTRYAKRHLSGEGYHDALLLASTAALMARIQAGLCARKHPDGSNSPMARAWAGRGDAAQEVWAGFHAKAREIAKRHRLP